MATRKPESKAFRDLYEAVKRAKKEFAADGIDLQIEIKIKPLKRNRVGKTEGK